MSKAPAIGIDLGTTYSCVGVWQNGKVDIIPNDMGERTTPSYVAFTDTERLVGDAAKNQITRNPTNTVFDAKRLIGRKFEDREVQGDIKLWPFKVVKDPKSDRPQIQIIYQKQEKKFFAEEISAMVLQKLKQTATDFLGKEVKDAIVTVPAYFNDSQRQATKDAGTISGLNVLRIINEPTAAAIAYGLDKKSTKEENVLIFDLGGGTFDLAILNLNCMEKEYKVKSKYSDIHLGGDDFDNKLAEYCINKCNFEKLKDKIDNKAKERLKKACEYAKKILSKQKNDYEDNDNSDEEEDITTTIRIDNFIENKDLLVSISKKQFENEICKELFDRLKFIIGSC